MYTVFKCAYALSQLKFTITLGIRHYYFLYFTGRKTAIQIIGIVKIDSLKSILTHPTITS